MKHNLLIRLSVMLVFLAGLYTALAQPTVSSVPAIGATGVSPGAAVVFTFSAAMNPDPGVTYAQFFDFAVGFTQLPVNSVWSAGNTVLTCTPSPAFANNHSITWVVTGEDTSGNELGGVPAGSFTTGSGGGGGGGGSGTNAVTSFIVGKSWQYDQTSVAAPVLDPDIPYLFSGLTTLASNRTATAVTLTFPDAGVSNLVQNFLAPEDYYLSGYGTNLTTFNAAYPAGDYMFTVTSNSANQQVTVNLPASTQPNAPHISNYTAAQSINPTQPFTLTWDAFTGGGSKDYISVDVGDVFESPNFGKAGALTGSATSITIPAATLMSGSNYDCTIVFIHAVVTTNSVGGYVTEAYLSALTQFSINTAGSGTAAPVLSNPTWQAGTFGFDIITSPGQQLTVVSSPTLNTASTSWPVLLTTNSPGNKVHISDPHSAANRTLFYRVRNGN